MDFILAIHFLAKKILKWAILGIDTTTKTLVFRLILHLRHEYQENK